MAYPGKRAIKVKDHVCGLRLRHKRGEKLDIELVYCARHRKSQGALRQKNKPAHRKSLDSGRKLFPNGPMQLDAMKRREFFATSTAIAASAALPAWAANKEEEPLRLGIDNFAVRAMGWKAKELIDYAKVLRCDSLFITDLGPFESFTGRYLKGVKNYADDKGIKIYVGSWSICPTSVTFKKDWGSAAEHLALGIRVSKILGSPAFRVILGSRKDRMTEGGIDARIDDTVKLLKANKSVAVDAGVKIAMENHAGDMHSLELARLVEEAGKDWVGVNLDSGNAVWTLEDPMENLKNLAPYVLTTSLRDTMAWPSENGYTAAWTAMGEGLVNWKQYFAYYRKVCPEAPVCIETISGFNHELKVKQDDFWKAWPKGKPKGYDKFEAFAKSGKAIGTFKPAAGSDRKKAQQQFQKADIERSIRYCRKLGLGQDR